MKKISAIISAVVLLMIWTAYVSDAADKTPEQMVSEAKASIKEVTPAFTKAIMDAKEKIIVLDVRDKQEFDEGHISGAINISRGMLEFKTSLIMPDKDSRIIVYCGVDLRGPLATKTLNELGYRNAVNMLGGLKAWKEAGLPIAK